MTIEVQDVVKHFTGTYGALRGVSFSIENGEMIGFLGPSGSGKTTLLRIIAGLERQTSGEVKIRGESVDGVPPQRRGVGFVFQNYALFKHMTVFDNIAFGLRVQKLPSDRVHKRVSEMLNLVRLGGLERRYPRELSGGQAQRVALARALAPNPSVLLLDEPFSAIDSQVRRELRKWIRQIHDEVGITSIFVTHDQEEALEVADRVLVMNQGHIEQFATPKEVYETPSNLFVAGFVGEANRFTGTVQRETVSIGPIQLPVKGHPEASEVSVVIRPTDIEIRSPRIEDDAIGTVVQSRFKGTHYDLEIRLTGSHAIHTYVASNDHPVIQVGDLVALEIRNYRVF
ncbi:ABC transporter ATP-binding protein [Alicyclobacillus fastidiosus]|uniref:ABC transporter ATP-binding protein n=1 Tax=Alicyclobacillus fastidiosus TaxID=392011 RepID=A0ABV5A9Y5_9BACL|nr:ABC transporter ATP-binding protein [Alicyclobacillus fastidiosus]WEH10929.1 ABC transporter ATP-binding protein [Alicyclobacillus fastidiosus]